MIVFPENPEFKDLVADDPLWESALVVLKQLRPDLTAESLNAVLSSDDAQIPTFSVMIVQGRVRAIAGWRLIANVNAGRKVYIDDLAVDASVRSAGFGAALMEYLVGKAKDLGCSTVDLDSGVQRFEAHRFYLRERFQISSHHFVKAL